MISGRGGSMMRGGRIRPPRRPTTQSSNTDEFEQCWEKLRQALRDIHLRNAGKLSFEQLYRYSYKIVLKKAGHKLYDRVKEFEEQWFADKVIPLIQSLITSNLISVTLEEVTGTSVVERRAMGEKFIKGIRASWEDHNFSMNMIADVLMYLERGYVQDHSRPSIYTATIGLFRDHILRSALKQDGVDCPIFKILNATIIDQINMEREGDVIDKALLHSCISMFEALFETDEENDNEQLYVTTFEPIYIESSEAFYQAECEKLLREGDASAWLRYTQRRLAEEAERCQTTVSPLSLQKITQVVERELIVKHMDEFLGMEGSGINAMLDNDRLEDLRILYQLISRVDPKKVVLRNALSTRVIEQGTEIEKALKNTDFSIAQQADAEEPVDGTEKSKPKTLNAAAQQTAAAIKWVDDVLVLKDKYDEYWRTCFEKDLILQTTLTKSFADFINAFNRSSEYVSLFIDDNLKRGIKGKTEAEVDTVLDKAITLLRYLGEKDKFEQYYQKHLARRLLHAKSESQEVEQEMISRMKRELGNNFTQKFEGMFRDMRTSKEETENYRDHIRGLGDVDEKHIDFNISVLAGNNWPKEIMGRTGLADGSKGKIIYPREIQGLQDSFFKFYSLNRNGRVLTWVASAGSADIKCVFPKIPGKTSGPLSKERRYELNVSTYGMIVLMLFNDVAEDEWLSFERIQEETNIPQSDLINALTSLSVIKAYRVLLKESQTKAAAKPGDRFTFNREFTSKAIKIKVPSINAANRVENDEERKETDQKNEETRMYVTDAAIVRIMKQRKELGHSQLITEVIQVLASRFKPDIPLIKRRIEALITREYLDRAELADGSPAYQYVA
ncbi:Cullin-domain-containing protein [Daldinia vernicosa]|uniref:Cullin-domain-containing protein n=1 Tax=Daldinia vernicosa TaxID=114800 RepID=UPI002007FF4F|nr:Cullin-domain-containing protein [Daldinia vernicosa]KAI0854166.1 Cullin-domain-containing protein [Daldinia vernicosa]